MILSRLAINPKKMSRRWRKLQEHIAARLLATRYGRRMLISAIGPQVLTMTVDCSDHVIRFSPHDYIGRKIFRKGHFERDHVDRLLAILREEGLLRRQSTLLELGGNIGTQTIYFALSQAFTRIVTVEADPRNFRLLSENIQLNGLQDLIVPVNCAAGDRCGEIDFYLNQNNHGKSSALRQSATDTRISVPVLPVADLLDAANAAVSDVGLVWMDIEGYEPVACRSMLALMARKTPIHMEFTPAFYGRSEAIALRELLAAHYSECIAFADETAERMKVRDLPVEGEQLDILLLR
jgi:FkbM family methyltransferase